MPDYGQQEAFINAGQIDTEGFDEYIDLLDRALRMLIEEVKERQSCNTSRRCDSHD